MPIVWLVAGGLIGGAGGRALGLLTGEALVVQIGQRLGAGLLVWLAAAHFRWRLGGHDSGSSQRHPKKPALQPAQMGKWSVLPPERAMTDEPKKSKFEVFKIPAGITLAILLIWGSLGWIASERDQPGTFGDMFGFANSLFSGLAFAGIIYTIYLQRQELRLQQEELRLQRKELRMSVEAQQASAESLEKQVKLAAAAAKINALTTLLDDEKQVLTSFEAAMQKILRAPQFMSDEVSRLNKHISCTQERIDTIKSELVDLTSILNLKNLDVFYHTSDL